MWEAILDIIVLALMLSALFGLASRYLDKED